MEDSKAKSSQNLGIAALITAIITFVLAVIPCIGAIAIIPGIVAILLAAVGLSQAARSDAPKGIIIAGLVIGIVAIMISFSQFFVVGKIIGNADKWPSDIRDAIEDVRKDVLKELEDSKVSIKVVNGNDSIEIKAVTGKKSFMVKQLEDLESNTNEKDTLKGNK